jgi:predicted short-subunit dehydrogenase-like oxidoreductase (DUF2520 family)
MSSNPRILLVGTGRMAYQLGHSLLERKADLVGVVGRNTSALKELSRFLDRRGYRLDEALPKADLLLLAVSDDAIAEVGAALPATDAVVAHTAGAKDMDVLAPHAHRGVLWPIQSLSHGAPVDLRDVPLVVDGNDDKALAMLNDLARRLSDSVLQLPHDRRQYIHLAAVLASNFPVFLLGEARRLLRAQQLPPDLLMPLWRMTAAKAAAIGPAEALTGPARRGDLETIREHLDLLTPEPDLRRAYALLSELILHAHGHRGTPGT